MRQLGGVDASFLYFETPETPMHVAGLTTYELPPEFEGSFYDHFKSFFAGRVHLVPIFAMKLARGPLDLDHPSWVEAGELDLDYHIRATRLPAPGTWRQLEEAVARLHSVPLDRSRPLWQFDVIEGLEDGQVALYSKVHHAAVDGGSGMLITKALYDLTPEPRAVEPPKPRSAPTAKPAPAARVASGVENFIGNVARQHMEAMGAVPKMMDALFGLGGSRSNDAGGEKKSSASAAGSLLSSARDLVENAQLLAPRSPFNVTITSGRSYAARSLPLADAKLIAKATGAKINDIVMAICGGALRTYLREKKALPKKPLVAFVPISIRPEGDTDIRNQVFGMNCALGTHLADPLERLQSIMTAAGRSKTMAGLSKEVAPKDFSLLGAPLLLPGLMNLYGKFGLADLVPQAVNLTISNTPGPPVPLYCAGAKVTALYPVSIPIHGVALNITVQSYCGALDFGITADARAVPDADHLADLLGESLAASKAMAAPSETSSWGDAARRTRDPS